MTKIVLIGAGSHSFGTSMLRDLFHARETLAGSTITLVDVNPAALRLMTGVAERLNAATGCPFVIEANTERTAALPGADFVIISVAVQRNQRWKLDFDIPLKHGVKQVLGENGGPGGLFHAMRNIPMILDICADIERLCPDALVLNFTNPEGRLCLAATRYTKLRFVGLCHGIGMAQTAVAQVLGLPEEEVDPKAGGLNHFSWIVDLRRTSTGEDLYPAFKQAMAERRVEEIGIPGYSWGIKLCHYLMDVYGLFPLPSDDHCGEYLGYAWEFCGLEGYHFDRADAGTEQRRAQLQRWADGVEAPDELLAHQSGERAVPIIAGVVTNAHQHELAVNIPNRGLIPNLPEWAVVEIPAIVDAGGVHGIPLGPLPEPIAAMCRTQVAVIDRVVEAGVHGDRNAALQALLLDPVVPTAAQAEAILNELLDVHRDFLPQFTV